MEWQQKQCHPIHNISEFILILLYRTASASHETRQCTSSIGKTNTVCASTFDCIDYEYHAFNRSKSFHAACLNRAASKACPNGMQIGILEKCLVLADLCPGACRFMPFCRGFDGTLDDLQCNQNVSTALRIGLFIEFCS